MTEAREKSWSEVAGLVLGNITVSVLCFAVIQLVSANTWTTTRLADHVRRIIKLEAKVKELELRLDAPAHMLNLITDEHGRRVLVDPNPPWNQTAGKGQK